MQQFLAYVLNQVSSCSYLGCFSCLQLSVFTLIPQLHLCPFKRVFASCIEQYLIFSTLMEIEVINQPSLYRSFLFCRIIKGQLWFIIISTIMCEAFDEVESVAIVKLKEVAKGYQSNFLIFLQDVMIFAIFRSFVLLDLVSFLMLFDLLM